jgi:hypothetical protein|tara:strand:- start:90 stop:245 length:156 start_codon:yes stop_codon:yes gene_type:complete
MIRKTVWALNFCLMAMLGYVYGYHDGITTPRLASVDQMAINYAIYEAMNSN